MKYVLIIFAVLSFLLVFVGKDSGRENKGGYWFPCICMILAALIEVCGRL